MDIKINTAKIVMDDGSEMPLSVRIAKQFPVRLNSLRLDEIINGSAPTAMCKVNATTVDKDLNGWLILVDTENGLMWDRPIFALPFAHDKGDDLAAIPTVILV